MWQTLNLVDRPSWVVLKAENKECCVLTVGCLSRAIYTTGGKQAHGDVEKLSETCRLWPSCKAAELWPINPGDINFRLVITLWIINTGWTFPFLFSPTIGCSDPHLVPTPPPEDKLTWITWSHIKCCLSSYFFFITSVLSNILIDLGPDTYIACSSSFLKFPITLFFKLNIKFSHFYVYS